MAIVKDNWKTIYRKKGKHRRKCYLCGQLLKDDSPVIGRQVVTEKLYPVKGIMTFSKWQFRHEECPKETLPTKMTKTQMAQMLHAALVGAPAPTTGTEEYIKTLCNRYSKQELYWRYLDAVEQVGENAERCIQTREAILSGPYIRCGDFTCSTKIIFLERYSSITKQWGTIRKLRNIVVTPLAYHGKGESK